MKIIKFLIYVLLFCFAICIADYIQHFGLLPNIVYEFKFIEILNFLATLSLGLSIPYIISKAIDNEKAKRSFLVEECKNMLDSVSNINNLILSISINSVITDTTKDEILFVLEKSEKQLDNLIFFLDKANLPMKIYNSHYFKNSFLKYWEDITGGQLMSNGFVFTDEFRSKTTSSYFDLEKEIKNHIVDFMTKS